MGEGVTCWTGAPAPAAAAGAREMTGAATDREAAAALAGVLPGAGGLNGESVGENDMNEDTNGLPVTPDGAQHTDSANRRAKMDHITSQRASYRPVW